MSQTLDEEVLESLAYERSKTWSKFLQSCAEKEDGREIEMSELGDLFENENDEDSFVGLEEAEESPVEDDIHNTTTQNMTKAELTLMMSTGDNKEILDHTMPIVKEHMRKWKEAGLDRILNTFDANKIEQHVGDWLRRNNSVYSEKTLRYKPYERISSSSEDSDAESMHSVETARYIRDSRKQSRTVSSVTKCKSPMTTIKMYRTLPRKRAELRAKYACHEFNEEQEHRHHMQTLIQRRKQLHRRQRERELIYHTSPRHYIHHYGVAASFNGPQLRRRREDSRMFPCTSSSEDEHGPSRCGCSSCASSAFSKTTYPYHTYRSYHSHSHSQSHSYRDFHHGKQRMELGSRSMASVMHFKRGVRQLRRQHAFEDDLRPRLVENECSCCNKDRLCSNVVHIANSSTEEWIVENKSSPDPIHFESPKSCKMTPKNRTKMHEKAIKSSIRKKTAAKTLHLPEVVEDYLMEEPEPKPTFTTPKAISKSRSAVTFSSVEQTSPSALPSVKKTTVSKSKSVPSAKKLKHLPTVSKVSEIKMKSNNVNELPTNDLKSLQSSKKTNLKATSAKSASVPSAKKENPLSTASKVSEVSKESKNVIDLTTPDSKSISSIKKPPLKSKSAPPSSIKEKSPPTVEISKESNNVELPTKTERKVATKATKPKKAATKSNRNLNKNNNKAASKEKTDAGSAVKQRKRIQIVEPSKSESESDDDLQQVKQRKRIQIIESSESVSDDDLQQALTLSKQTYALELEKLHLTTDPAKISNTTTSSSCQLPEPSIFNNHSVACNSTALTNDTACRRTLEVNPITKSLQSDLCSTECDNDCTLVTSTTGCEAGVSRPKPAVTSERPSFKISNNGILLYEPPQTTHSISSSNSHGNFTLTEQTLTPIIGERRARKFLKYYTGSCSFDSRYSVYYRPPKNLLASLSSDTKSLDLNSSSSSGSEDDMFEIVERYGVIHTMLEKSKDTC